MGGWGKVGGNGGVGTGLADDGGMWRLIVVGGVVAGVVIGVGATAQQSLPPDYGFDFVTIGDVGNVAYEGLLGGGRITSAGSVNYEYRMARTELRTSQFSSS